MADFTANNAPSNAFARSFGAFFRGFLALSEKHARNRAANAVSHMSSAQLEATGTTPKDLARRILNAEAIA